MTKPASHRPAGWRSILGFALVATGFFAGAALVMFSAFMYYDDEGYVLISLLNFARHGGLYGDVYTQYGPFPFGLYSALHALGFPFTHTAGRIVTLLFWGGTAVLCAVLASHATRRRLAGIATLGGVFIYLWVMASEPTHPGGLIVLLTAVAAALGYRWIGDNRVRWWAFMTGAVTALLVLTKINIGVFAAFSAVSWFCLHHRNDLLRRWAPALLAVAAALLPFALMRALLGTYWVQVYAGVFAAGAVTTLLASSVAAERRVGWSELAAGLVGAVAVSIPVLALLFLRGTTVQELLDGILFGPLRQPTNFNLRYVWPPGIIAVAVLSFGLCMTALARRRRGGGRLDVVIASLRLIAALGVAVALIRFPALNPGYVIFGLTLPAIWLFAWPLAGETGPAVHARTWLALLLLGQCLHVFPVPGSQIAWGSVLALPLAAIGTWQAATWLRQRYAPGPAAAKRIAAGGIAAVVVLVASMGVGMTQIAQRIREGRFLALPGAELLRLPDDSVALFRLLTFNAVTHGDLLFSEPGMFSFNLWSGLPTPTYANVTHWFSLLSTPQQEAIIRELEANPHACVIVHREHIAFLAERGLPPRGVLHDYIARNFEPAFTLDAFEFSVRRGRRVAPFFVGDFLVRSPDATNAGPERALVTMPVLLPPQQAVSAVRLFAPHNPGLAELTLDATNARVEVTPINSRGEISGSPAARAWPFTVSGPAIVSVYHNQADAKLDRRTVIEFRDDAGNEIALGRLRQ